MKEQHVVVLLVLQHDRAIAPRIGRTGSDAGIPVPQRAVLGVAALESDHAELAQPGQLTDVVDRVFAFAIIDRVAIRSQSRDLAERSHCRSVDLDAEIKAPIGIDPVRCLRHDAAPLTGCWWPYRG